MKNITIPVVIIRIEKNDIHSLSNGRSSPYPTVVRVSITKSRDSVQEIGLPSRTG